MRLPNPLLLSEKIGVVLLFLGGIPAFASIPDGYAWLAENPIAPAILAALPIIGIGLLERRRLPRTVRMLSRGLVFGLLAPALVGVLMLTALPLVSLVAGVRAYFGGAGWVTPAALVTAGVTLVVSSGGDREFVEGIAPLQSAPTVAYVTVVAFTWAAAGILLSFRPPPGYDTA